MLGKNFLLGVGVTNATEKEILEYILQGLKKTGGKYYIVTPNPEILVYANKHKDFKEILNNARLALCDGIGVIWAGKILGKEFKEQVTGVDFMGSICREVAKEPITVGFLGGGPKIAERTAECLVEEYPGLKVGFVGQEWPESQTDLASISAKCNPSASLRTRVQSAKLSFDLLESEPRSRRPELKTEGQFKIKNKQKSLLNTIPYTLYPMRSIDILFVAFGFPKQEEWMSEHVGKVPVRIMVGVGGAFDYLSHQVPRAPIWVRQLGFEWLFRLIVQPWRLKRQLSLLEFIYLVFKEKLRF